MKTIRAIIARILLPIGVVMVAISSCDIKKIARSSYDKGYYTDLAFGRTPHYSMEDIRLFPIVWIIGSLLIRKAIY